MISLVFLAAAAWTLQALFSLFQYRTFQSRFNSLSGNYNIGIGQWRNKFGFGAIVIVCADEQGIIEKVEFMQGLTVFSRFRSIKGYIGKSIYNELQFEGLNDILTNAFKAALLNTKKVMGGEKRLESINCV